MIAIASSQLGCSGGNVTCYCTEPDFGYGVRDCANEACTSDEDANTVISFGTSYCANALQSYTSTASTGAPTPANSAGSILSQASGATSAPGGTESGDSASASSTETVTASATGTSALVGVITTDGSTLTTTTGSTTLYGGAVGSATSGAASLTSGAASAASSATGGAGSAASSATGGAGSAASSATGGAGSAASSATGGAGSGKLHLALTPSRALLTLFQPPPPRPAVQAPPLPPRPMPPARRRRVARASPAMAPPSRPPRPSSSAPPPWPCSLCKVPPRIGSVGGRSWTRDGTDGNQNDAYACRSLATTVMMKGIRGTARHGERAPFLVSR